MTPHEKKTKKKGHVKDVLYDNQKKTQSWRKARRIFN